MPLPAQPARGVQPLAPTQLFGPRNVAAPMVLMIQRSPDPVPYRGAYFRISAADSSPTRGSVVLPPQEVFGDDTEGLSLLLGLAIVLGEPRMGTAPIRQHWLSADLRLEGKMGAEIAAPQAEAASEIATRIRVDWHRFLANALARLSGEERGSAHFRFPADGWDVDRPAILVTAWPPLAGQPLPPLE
jgi:hypothetical protein